MISQWSTNQFKIAINMAGAVSAGAYTAGVLDFLMEALEEWEKAKIAFRAHLAQPASSGAFASPVPLHDVSLEAFSGASAGGMCAAIASVMVQRPFDHVTDPKASGTNNTFYESWVNKIDISGLLGTDDLKGGKPLVSLLDSTIIDDIARYALTFNGAATPSYVSESLTLFLTLTNVRGVPYRLYNDPSPSLDEFITYYADRLRFETVQNGGVSSCPTAKPLPLDQAGSPGWMLLQDAAKATGAFPLFLASRPLKRDLGDFNVPMWIPVSGPDPTPSIPSDLPGPPESTIETLNVDGGVTDNDPFDLAHDFLASHNPRATPGAPPTNPRGPLDANCAVISVAPFPSVDRFNPKYDVQQSQDLFTMLGRLGSVLISQSRFQGESLGVLASGAAFSRFVIAPSDDGNAAVGSGSPLQCARLGAFGGFMERSFRAHDFLLGRRNCQKFLESYFRLPAGNPVMASALAGAGSYAARIQTQFALDRPDGVTVEPVGKVWMPVIPLVGSAATPIPSPARGTISKTALARIADAVIARIDAVKTPLLANAPAAWLLKSVVGLVCSWPTRLLVRSKIVDALSKSFGPDVVGS
jgi:hypothetical protein